MDNNSNPRQGIHAMEPEGEEASLNLRHYWHVILERRWLVIVTFISVFILSVVYIFQAEKIYRATARLQIDKEYETVLGSTDAIVADSREQDYMQTQYKNLESRTLIEEVIEKLNLEEDPRYVDELDKAKAVLDDITISPIRLSRLVDISVEHSNPTQAKAIANTLVETFVANNLNHKLNKAMHVLKYLEMEAGTLENKLTEAEQEMQQYKEKIGAVSLEKDQDIVFQALSKARLDLAEAESEATSAQSVAQEVEQMVMDGYALSSVPQISRDTRVASLQAQLAQYNAELDSLLVRYKDKWPAVMQLREKIASLKSTIDEQAKEIYRTIQLDAEQAQARVEELKKLVDERKQENLRLNQHRIEYDILARRANERRTLYQTVLKRIEEENITSKSDTNNMRVVDAAILPLKPVKPRIILVLLLGIAGGCAAGVGLAFFVNYLDDSIKTQDDVETYLRMPFLGYIPNIKAGNLIERDLQSHLYPQSTAAEAFRTLRATISLMPNGDSFKVIALTSTIPSEGKSLVASNLAVVFAQTGLKTVIVDADLRRPSVHKAFQLHSPVGMTGYLRHEVVSPQEIIRSCEVPNLHVVCCGAVPDNPSELIGSKTMAEFLAYLRENFDRVIVDCPPVSAVSDPLVLSAKSDGVIFVNKFNRIRREHARRSIQRLQDAGIRVLGVTLNDIDFEGRDSYYYSYYYYQNRYYSSHYRSAAKDGRDKKKEAKDEKSAKDKEKLEVTT